MSVFIDEDGNAISRSFPDLVTVPRAELEAIRDGVFGLQKDLLDRAEWCPDAGKVVCAGNGAWFRFNEALAKLEAHLKGQP